MAGRLNSSTTRIVLDWAHACSLRAHRSQQWSGTGPEIAKRWLREGIQVLAGLGRALLASAEIVTNIIGAD